MSLGSRQKIRQLDPIDIYLDNELIQTVQSQKLLGVIIDQNLSWDKQIDAVCLNVTRRITLLKMLSKYIDTANMTTYYNSYILPILDYGCMIWGRCSKGNLLRLVKLQKRAARIILNSDLMTPSETMFKRLKWLSFPKRVEYHTCIMTFKALNGLAPEYIKEIFIQTSDVHTRNLRSVFNEELRIPKSRSNFYENSFAVTAAKHWNKLPTDIRNVKTINQFKVTLKSYLLHSS